MEQTIVLMIMLIAELKLTIHRSSKHLDYEVRSTSSESNNLLEDIESTLSIKATLQFHARKASKYDSLEAK